MGNKYSFAVTLPSKQTDPSGFYKKGLVNKLVNQYPWLTVAGLDAPDTLKSGRKLRGIQYAGPGNVLTFGTAKNHDVNWVERPDYAREKGYVPVFDIVKDWNSVVSRLDAFAASKRPVARTTYSNCYGCSYSLCGYNTPVEVYDNFIKIGYRIIPRYPRVNDYYMFQEPEVYTMIVKIKGLF